MADKAAPFAIGNVEGRARNERHRCAADQPALYPYPDRHAGARPARREARSRIVRQRGDPRERDRRGRDDPPAVEKRLGQTDQGVRCCASRWSTPSASWRIAAICPTGAISTVCSRGSARGSLAAQLAHVFTTEIVARSDYGIDLHSAGLNRENLPQIRVSPDKPPRFWRWPKPSARRRSSLRRCARDRYARRRTNRAARCC